MNTNFDIGIVGAGAIGLATAYKLQLRYPHLSIAVFDKAPEISYHQTGRNSGVIHSGIYYRPGSFKARNCVDGRHQLVTFARKHNIPHDVCGKIILATEESELPNLEKIFTRGKDNAIEGIEMIGPKTIAELEPQARGIKAIHVPVAGIIDFKAVCKTFWDEVKGINPKSTLFLDTEVFSSFHEEGRNGLLTSKGKFGCRKLVFCAGLQADRLAERDGLKLDVKIVGFRGDYYELTEKGKPKVKNLIYPVPDPAFPFLGVHFTRMTDGSVECGPNAVFSFKREGYSRTAFDWKDTSEALQFGGTRKFFSKHYKKGATEYRRAFSKSLFLKALQKMVPGLGMEDITRARSGVRALALSQSGELVDDFYIRHSQNAVHVINAPSPAATACMAIADGIVKTMEERLADHR